ncbi:MAG: lipoate-protein ligase B, partial [Chitinophagaceae bacterium]|nr:lipoate-protein ligase B [Chitinophagaceae bacterium]
MIRKENIRLEDLGSMEYQQAWDYQEKLLADNVAAKKQFALEIVDNDSELPLRSPTIHHLLFVEHPPVYTLGKSGKEEHVLIDEKTRIEKGISFYRTNRGGDITFHGPGQIVGYPILDLEKFYT